MVAIHPIRSEVNGVSSRIWQNFCKILKNILLHSREALSERAQIFQKTLFSETHLKFSLRDWNWGCEASPPCKCSFLWWSSEGARTWKFQASEFCSTTRKGPWAYRGYRLRKSLIPQENEVLLEVFRRFLRRLFFLLKTFLEQRKTCLESKCFLTPFGSPPLTLCDFGGDPREKEEKLWMSPRSRKKKTDSRAELKRTSKLKGTDGFLQTVCGFLGDSAVSYGFLRKSAPLKCCILREKKEQMNQPRLGENERTPHTGVRQDDPSLEGSARYLHWTGVKVRGGQTCNN